MPKGTYWIIVVALALCSASLVDAQFQLPTKSSYSHSLPTVLNSSETPQVRSGGVATLGLQLIQSNVSDSAWVQLVRGAGIGVPSLVTDSPVVVYRHSVATIDPMWQLSRDNFGFDTNAPISVNGLWSERGISTSKAIETAALSIDSIKDSQSTLNQVPMCVDVATGGLVLCGGVAKPIITFTSSPSTVMAGSNDTVQLNWTASNASECHALAGDGFFTNKEVAGTDVSNSIRSSAGSSEVFMIACTNDMGVMSFKTVTVKVQ